MNIDIVVGLFVLVLTIVLSVVIYFLLYFPTDNLEYWVVFWYRKANKDFYIKCKIPNWSSETIEDAFEEVTHGASDEEKSLFNTAKVIFPVQGIFGWGRGRYTAIGGSSGAYRILEKVFPLYIYD